MILRLQVQRTFCRRTLRKFSNNRQVRLNYLRTLCECGGEISVRFLSGKCCSAADFCISTRVRTVFWSSSLKSLTPLSDRTLLHGMMLFSEINREPASSLSTQAQRCKPRSASELSALCFKYFLDNKISKAHSPCFLYLFGCWVCLCAIISGYKKLPR